MRTLFSGLFGSTKRPQAAALLALTGILACVPLRGDQTAPLTLGSTITISVTADGTQPFSYQWKKDGVDLAGKTSASLVIDSAVAGDVGTYSVVVSNSVGSTISDAAILTTAPVAPAFSTHPNSQNVLTGGTVTFTAVATGTAPVTYQWRKDGVNVTNTGGVTGATSNTLTIPNVTTAFAGSYSLIATNSVTSVSSNAAVLTVTTPPPTNQAPVFATQPVGQVGVVGQSVTFTAVANALPAATYQWKKNGVNLTNGGNVAGATFNTLTLSNLTNADAATYTVVATNVLGSVTSDAAQLIVKTNQVPVVVQQPANQVANLGQAVFFTIQISGFPDPVFQWRKNGVNLANGGNVTGATSNTLALSNVSASDVATYSVVVSNSQGSVTSTDATLTVNGGPVFLSQPPATSLVASGTIVQLAVTVAGNPTPTVQWRKNGANLANGGIVSGATTTTLTLNGVTSADAALYSVVATNSQGSTTSGNFELVVQTGSVSNQPATTGKDVALSAPNASGNVHWQMSTDSGANWSDLANDSTYSGVNSGTLYINDVTPALNTVVYRLVTVTNGTTTVLHSAKLNVTAAFVPFPVGLSADDAGNVYVVDTANDTVEKINIASQITTLAGTAGQTGTTNGTGAAARFNDPSGVSAASDGTLAVADKANGTIRLITPAGVVTTFAGSTTLRGNVDGTGTSATFSSPLGVARDTSGNLYVADAQNHTIRKITAAGVVTTLAGSAGQAGTSDGTGTSARFNNPTGIEVDLGGNIYVADTGNNLIRKVTSTGTVTTLAGLANVSGASNGTGSFASFNQPGGLAVDNVGNIYVADTANSAIRRITPEGVVTTIAGLATIAGHKDGAGIEAWFNQPRDVAVSSTGFLYVADTGNASIRRIDQSGTVTTLAITLPTNPDTTPTNPLPETPPLPSTPTLPTIPTSPTPPTQPSSGGGGGGAPSLWFFGALASMALLRRLKARRE